jgi:hypothetical protein
MDTCGFAHPIRWGVALLTATVALGACDDSVTEPPANGASTLSVFLKDKAGDVDSVWVQVDDVVLQGDDGGVSLLDAPTELLNITALTDSTTPLVQDLAVDSGSYREVRFMIGGAVLQSGSGDVYVLGDVEHPHGLAATGDLMCPSCAQTGIKVKLSDDVELGEGDNGLLLDFDVSQSFGHQAGKSGKWVMHPVIHGATGEPGEMEDDEAGGEIHGTVAMGTDDQGDPLTIPMCGGEDRTLEEFVPLATATTLTDDEGAALVFSGETEVDDGGEPEDGAGSTTFEIDVTGLDTFTLGYQAETTFDEEKLVWTASVEPTEVTLDEGNDEASDVAYTVDGVTCEPVVTP